MKNKHVEEILNKVLYDIIQSIDEACEYPANHIPDQWDKGYEAGARRIGYNARIIIDKFKEEDL